MKKILGLIGSPRKPGNCEIMVKEISRNLSAPHNLKLIRLQDFKILPCRGCYSCLFKEERCVLDDDLYQVLDAIVEADALIVAVPAYFLSANSSLKCFLDRGLSFYSKVERLWGKPAVGVGVAGIEGKEGFTLLGIESFLKLIFAENKRSTIIYGALPGEIFLSEENRKKAAELASALFAPLPDRKDPSCPLCGGDTFRFFGGNKVRCMLCSNSGTVIMESGTPVLKISKSQHELFLSREEVQRHKEWLQSMKMRFIQQKEKLKAISAIYPNDGSWIKPVHNDNER